MSSGTPLSTISSSTTVTVNDRDAGAISLGSLAVQVTVVTPTGNVDPGRRIASHGGGGIRGRVLLADIE